MLQESDIVTVPEAAADAMRRALAKATTPTAAFHKKVSTKAFILLLTFIMLPLSAEERWTLFKKETISKMRPLSGWCSEEKALMMMDLIKDNRCTCCVEIGVFAGKSLLPMARALQYSGIGKVYAIDPWDPVEAVQGFSLKDPQHLWWSSQDFGRLHRSTQLLIKQYRLQEFCVILKETSGAAANRFEDETIDLIHFDGNHNSPFSFQDVASFFPKVKEGGYLLLNDPNWFSMRCALVFLLERADLLSPFDPQATFFLFQKKGERLESANALTY